MVVHIVNAVNAFIFYFIYFLLLLGSVASKNPFTEAAMLYCISAHIHGVTWPSSVAWKY